MRLRVYRDGKLYGGARVSIEKEEVATDSDAEKATPSEADGEAEAATPSQAEEVVWTYTVENLPEEDSEAILMITPFVS